MIYEFMDNLKYNIGTYGNINVMFNLTTCRTPIPILQIVQDSPRFYLRSLEIIYVEIISAIPFGMFIITARAFGSFLGLVYNIKLHSSMQSSHNLPIMTHTRFTNVLGLDDLLLIQLNYTTAAVQNILKNVIETRI